VYLDHIDQVIDCYYTWGKIHSDYGRHHLAVKYFRPIAELEILFYGGDVVDRPAYQSLKTASDSLGDKNHFEAVREKVRNLDKKHETESSSAAEKNLGDKTRFEAETEKVSNPDKKPEAENLSGEKKKEKEKFTWMTDV